MNTKQRLRVITENGRIVGTQFVAPPVAGKPAVSCALHAGPGQQVHEIDIEPLVALRTVEQIHEFHETVARQLGPDALYGRK
jgi:hypothetical protein